MTKKERTLKAIELLIERYQWLLNNAPINRLAGYEEDEMLYLIKKDKRASELFRSSANSDIYRPGDNCPLCDIHSYRDCAGCPECGYNGDHGCSVEGYYYRDATIKRIKYWILYYAYLKDLPEKYFTIEGWRYEKMKGWARENLDYLL